jgi:hypothetical protein
VQQAGGQLAEQQKFPEQRLEIVAASEVAAGAEVHNTYVSDEWGVLGAVV